MGAFLWNKLLSLLCLMILADNKVYLEEVEAFQSAAVELKDAVCPETMLTPHMAKEWFFLHKEELSTALRRADFDEYLTEIFVTLDEMQSKDAVIIALLKIALSDGHKHGQENKIIDRAARAWNLELEKTA